MVTSEHISALVTMDWAATKQESGCKVRKLRRVYEFVIIPNPPFKICLELRLPPTSTTTPVPYIPSTQKPRRKQQQQQNNKNIIPDVMKAKDIFITNPFGVDNDAVNPAVESKNRKTKITS